MRKPPINRTQGAPIANLTRQSWWLFPVSGIALGILLFASSCYNPDIHLPTGTPATPATPAHLAVFGDDDLIDYRWSSKRNLLIYSSSSGLYIMEGAHGKIKQIEAGYILSFVLSSDEKTIFYFQSNVIPEQNPIYRYDLDGDSTSVAVDTALTPEIVLSEKADFVAAYGDLKLEDKTSALFTYLYDLTNHTADSVGPGKPMAVSPDGSSVLIRNEISQSEVELYILNVKEHTRQDLPAAYAAPQGGWIWNKDGLQFPQWTNTGLQITDVLTGNVIRSVPVPPQTNASAWFDDVLVNYVMVHTDHFSQGTHLTVYAVNQTTLEQTVIADIDADERGMQQVRFAKSINAVILETGELNNRVLDLIKLP